MEINPRRVARDILVQLDRGPLDLQRAIAKAFPEGSSTRDRALASELVWGVARWRYRLDALLRKATGRRVKELDRSARALLRMGLYQLIYLDRVPPSAAVNETVRLAGNNRRLKGFINGVLRRCAEKMPTLDDGGDPARLLGQSAGLPPWLAERWWQRYGEADATARAHQANTPARLTLRVNTAACTVADYLARLAAMGVEARASERVAGAVCLSRFHPITELPGYDEGWIYVQDEASQWVGQLLAAETGERVLDACAAPGGKTTQLSAAVGSDGQVVAIEIDPARIPRLQENLTRLRADNVQLVTGDLATLSSTEVGAPFDRVLLDAPCSGLGVLGRHPEGKWWKTAATVDAHAKQQTALLARLAAWVKPGGVLVYAVCSGEREEGSEVVQQFLQQQDDFTVVSATNMLGDAATPWVTSNGFFETSGSTDGLDGFFAAHLVRRA